MLVDIGDSTGEPPSFDDVLERIRSERRFEPRALLWLSVYGTAYEALRSGPNPHNAPGARRVARREADAAVADFDKRFARVR